MSRTETLGLRQICREQKNRPQLTEKQQANLLAKRPQHRFECVTMPRPCPFVGCRHHLYLEATKAGSILFSHGQTVAALKKMDETCVLDVADRGGKMLTEIAPLLNVDPERVRQVERAALKVLRAKLEGPRK